MEVEWAELLEWEARLNSLGCNLEKLNLEELRAYQDELNRYRSFLAIFFDARISDALGCDDRAAY